MGMIVGMCDLNTPEYDKIYTIQHTNNCINNGLEYRV